MSAFSYAPAKVTPSTSKEDAEKGRRWYVVDATDQVLGRLASEIAVVIMGKNRGSYTPNVDDGDFVVVVNADKVRLTGGKEEKKEYHRHTGWMGGIKTVTARKMRERRPTDLLRSAVKGMLPKGTLGRSMNDKLKLFAGPQHTHVAQQPMPFEARK